MTPAVEICGLSHSFPGERGSRSGDAPPVAALEGVDLIVEKGEFVSVVGASGCGKSTLLKVVAGVLVPTAGRVAIDGEDVIGRPGRAAYMPQKDLLLPWRRALDNAILGAELRGLDRTEARRTAAGLFGRFGLGGFERSWPSELSGGMRQRLALLRTFLLGREVLLLDEPFGALDAITRREMIDWLQSVLSVDSRDDASARSVLFVTHDVEEALVLSDRVVVLGVRPGSVIAEIAVPYEHPRPVELVTTEASFVGLRAEVLAALRSGRGPSPSPC